jgi:Predicted membrane protein
MKKYPKYPIVVLCITLLLVLTSLVLTFIGAFQTGSNSPLFKTGFAGLLVVPILGWLMVNIYNRVHKDELDQITGRKPSAPAGAPAEAEPEEESGEESAEESAEDPKEDNANEEQ